MSFFNRSSDRWKVDRRDRSGNFVRFTKCSLAFSLTVVIANLAAAIDSIDDLGNCPIKIEQPASIEYSCDYGGTTYYFCCQTCVLDFKSDPERFAVGAPRADTGKDRTDDKLEFPPLPSTDFGQLVWMLNRPSVVIHAVALLVLLVFWLNRSRIGRATWFCILGLGIIDIAALVGTLTVRDFRDANKQATTVLVEDHNKLPTTQQLETLEESIHYTTLQKFGRPVRPMRHQAKPVSLSATYYRGNDERSSDVLNEGNYRTATLHIKLVDDAGDSVDYGDEINAAGLAVRIGIDRARGTASGYFKDEFMQRVYLTQTFDPTMGSTTPVPDRVGLVVTRPEQQWEGTFSIGTGAVSQNDHFTGIVYVCEERYSVSRNERLGGRFHYAIEYDLYLEDGRLRMPSDLWMGATYEGLEYDTMDISPDEWLSLEPLPELPELVQ